MNLYLICAGLLFFLNPCVWIWDIAPDFIGALFIILGMRKIVFLNERTEQAHRRLWIVALVGATKLFVSITLYGASGIIKLLFALIFSVLELVFLVPLTFSIPTLLDDLQTRYLERGDTVYENSLRGLSRLLPVYTVFRVLISIIPDFTELSGGEEYSSSVSSGFDLMSDAKGTLTALALIICSVGLIIAVVMTISAVKKYSKGASCLVKAVRAADELKAQDPAEWLSKRWSALKIPFTASMILSIYFYVDGVDYFPKVIAALVMCALTYICSSSLVEKILSSVSCAAIALATFLCGKDLSSFYSDFGGEVAVLHSSEAKERYFAISILLVIQSSLLFASFIMMMRSVRRQKIAQLDELGGRERLIKSFKRRMNALCVFFTLAVLVSIAYPLFLVAFPEIRVILVLSGVIPPAIALFSELEMVY